MYLLYFVVFISAFLLFQIELIIGKIFLPNYGGSYFVWGACIVFFQAALFAGYAFSHFVIRWLGITRYRFLHLAIIASSFLFFPGRSLPLRYSLTNLPIVIDVFLKLLVTIGPVFFVLSTISIVTQSWVANSKLPQKNNPYILFGISNFGSFLALMTYPFIFENYYDLSFQVNIWRIGYVALAVFQLIVFIVIKIEKEVVDHTRAIAISKRVIIEWCLYSAAAVILFLSVTNVLVLEIAPMPFLFKHWLWGFILFCCFGKSLSGPYRWISFISVFILHLYDLSKQALSFKAQRYPGAYLLLFDNVFCWISGRPLCYMDSSSFCE